MLSLRAAIDALLSDIDRAIAGFAKLATQHRDTPMVARTWLQHALPMPFGLKLAEYAAALHRSRARLFAIAQRGRWRCSSAAPRDPGSPRRQRIARGGAISTGAQAAAAAAPWHTHRDRIAEAASVFAILAGTCGKIARDIQLMMQTDVAEAFEPAAKAAALFDHAAQAQSRRCRDRARRGHHGAWSRRHDFREPGAGSRAQRRAMARGMADLADAAARHIGRARRDRRFAEGLEVDAARMRVNLDAPAG